MINGGHDHIFAIFVTELPKAFITCTQGRNLRPHIAQGKVRKANIGFDQIHQCIVKLTPVKQFDAGELKSLLKYFGGIGSPGARVLAPTSVQWALLAEKATSSP